jgi:hypothetical protein
MKPTTLSPRDMSVSLEDRLRHGRLSIDEILALGDISRSKFYADVRAGLIRITKNGRRTHILGADAQAYLAGGGNAPRAAKKRGR